MKAKSKEEAQAIWKAITEANDNMTKKKPTKATKKGTKK